MARNDFAVFGRTEQVDASCADVSVRCAVETVTADAVFLVIFVGESVHVCKVGHCLMESRVENGDLRHAGEKLLESVYALEICGIVERSERDAFFNRVLDGFGYFHRTAEFAAAVQDSVSHGFYLADVGHNAALFIGEGFYEHLYRVRVIRLRRQGFVGFHFAHLAVSVGEFVRKSGEIRCELLKDAVAQFRALRHFEYRIFE